MPRASWASKFSGSFTRTCFNFSTALSNSPRLKSNIASSYASVIIGGRSLRYAHCHSGASRVNLQLSSSLSDPLSLDDSSLLLLSSLLELLELSDSELDDFSSDSLDVPSL